MKRILLKIAALPARHQRWVIKQLPESLATLFFKLNGPGLLTEANKFRGLPADTLPQLRESPKLHTLPKLCERLAEEPLLLRAIILNKGQFSWTEAFIQKYPQSNDLPEQVRESLSRMKEKTKEAVYKHWCERQGFNDFVEHSHHG